LIDAWPEGKVEWELDITPFYSNLNGVMHGGAAGVIFGTSLPMRSW
jgi:acyl-coenzyme A thioesterase 13